MKRWGLLLLVLGLVLAMAAPAAAKKERPPKPPGGGKSTLNILFDGEVTSDTEPVSGTSGKAQVRAKGPFTLTVRPVDYTFEGCSRDDLDEFTGQPLTGALELNLRRSDVDQPGPIVNSLVGLRNTDATYMGGSVELVTFRNFSHMGLIPNGDGSETFTFADADLRIWVNLLGGGPDYYMECIGVLEFSVTVSS